MQDKYTGFLSIEMTADELNEFYSNILPNQINKYSLIENQYFIIKTKEENKLIDKYKWAGGRYEAIPFYSANSKMFGKVVPKNGDIYQQLALDSLYTNQVTMIRGSAGTGKSLLSFAVMFDLLERGIVNKIIVFCNTVATKGAAKLGYYPGDRTEKLLDSQIGNVLESKVGSKIAVETMIEEGQLVLLPLSDIRGYDTSGMNAAVYISEAQNLDIEMLKLALQRIGDDSICIVDGDFDTQVDMSCYEGEKNGMRRMSEVFRGQNIYGEIELQNIYRSRVAEIAQEM